MFSRKIWETLAILLGALFLLLASSSPASSQDCLTCHGQAGMTSATGRNISINQAKLAASPHGILACKDCHTTITGYPHPAKIPQVNCSQCHTDESSDLPKSVHAVLGETACATCHGNAHEIMLAAKIVPEKCAECHTSEVKDLGESIHGQAAKKGDPDAPGCLNCHGPVHKILAAEDPNSTVAKQNLPDTCANCHANPGFLSRHNIPFAHPVDSYRESVHGRAVAAGNLAAATCSNCHGSHSIFPADDRRSKVNHWVVVNTCGACHTDIAKIYKESIHGQAVAAGAAGAPVCTDCHGEHLILGPENPNSPVSAGRVSLETCGRCHGNARLDARYNLPADRVPTFADSYHGLASREGSQTVANCASCHGVHNIFRSSDPRSTVYPANLAATCGKCHPGAGEKFAIGLVHVSAATPSEPVVVKWIRLTYWVIIPFAVGFMFLHQLLDFLKKLRQARPRVDSGEVVPRMNLNFRIAHWLTMVSFPVLVVTGFALKFPEAWWVHPMLLWERHFSSLRATTHRVAAVVLLASLGYHVLHLMRVRKDRRAILRGMIPNIDDAKAMVQMIAYNLGFTQTRPTFGKFNYAEKIEYLAFLWGTMIMAVTGFTLWFNSFALRHFPKWVTDAATALHFYEAILATLAILIWHMYTVVFDPDVYPMDPAWLTGNTSADHIRHTRPAYYAELTAEEKPESAHDQEAPDKSKLPWR